MTTAQYLRLHANATPGKLRRIIKEIIFVHDDVDYLKRLVRDVGGMDYVFRFLWYDGPVPTERSGTAATASEDGKCGCGAAAAPATTHGRTWIQYCCYHNAHRCLQWIFQEIVRNHLHKEHQHLKENEKDDQRITDVSSVTMKQSDDSSIRNANDVLASHDDGDHKKLVKIIQKLLEFPSASYCGSHYMAVATLSNSHQCLSLLLEYGGVDPNSSINYHGSTAAHLAAWKDHIECLHILKSGTYACMFDDGDESIDELSLHSSTTGESDDFEERDFSPREAFVSLLTATVGKEKTWAAEWTRANDLGETPLHVAAREGSLETMQFFLGLAMSSATGALREDDEQVEAEEQQACSIDFSMRNNDGMDCVALAAKHDRADIISLISEAIEGLLDASFDGPSVGLTSPFTPTFPSLSTGDSLQNPLSHLQSPVDYRTASPSKSAPQSPSLSANRRRAKSEPVNMFSNELSTPGGKPPQSPGIHQHHRQQCLPHYFPSLNLRNSLDAYNHEMPIHIAARYGNCKVIETLFKSGNCDTTARDSLGQTALHVAAMEGHLDACQLFVYLAGDQFEDFDVVDLRGRSPLYIACSLGISTLVRILFPVSNWRVICHERKKSPDGPLWQTVAHQPPFHAAVVNDHVNTVSELLDCGVDVNQTDMNGRTAISAAAKLGYHEMCQMLILHGANVNTRSARGGPTPFQKAKKYKHQDVADLLYEFGGR